MSYYNNQYNNNYTNLTELINHGFKSISDRMEELFGQQGAVLDEILNIDEELLAILCGEGDGLPDDESEGEMHIPELDAQPIREGRVQGEFQRVEEINGGGDSTLGERGFGQLCSGIITNSSGNSGRSNLTNITYRGESPSSITDPRVLQFSSGSKI